MVNAGAIATTSLVPGGDGRGRSGTFVRDGLSSFAGRELELDEDVYASESADQPAQPGHRPSARRATAGSTSIPTRPPTSTPAVLAPGLTAHDLAVMGATLADGGVNPMTGEQVVDAGVCRRVLAVMATAGLYERPATGCTRSGFRARAA